MPIFEIQHLYFLLNWTNVFLKHGIVLSERFLMVSAFFLSAFAMNSYAIFLQNTDYFTENFEDKNHFYLAVALKPLNWATFCCQCSFEHTWKIFWTAGKNSDYHLTVSQRCEYCGLFSLWLFMAYLQYNHTKSGL